MIKNMFVARQAQLGQLYSFLNSALVSQGQVAFVVGEANSGKTTMITEFASRAEASHRDARWLLRA